MTTYISVNHPIHQYLVNILGFPISLNYVTSTSTILFRSGTLHCKWNEHFH